MGIIDELDREIELVMRRRRNVAEFMRRLGRIDDAVELEGLGSKAPCEEFRLASGSLKELRVAAVMDQFTLESYRPECSLLEVTPDNWKEELEEFGAELLFIESAWKGKDGLWYRKVDRSSREMYEMTAYCHERGIPVVFWNKEDPVYTEQFMTTAALADYVFTTDIDCVQRYKTELGHEQVYHLHFAAQPQLHNPVEKYERKDKFCFAGAYYHRYPHRAEVFDSFSEVFIGSRGFDIYDRNYGNARPEHAFPDRYNEYILGSLPSSEIDVAYKGYIYGVNMNSVQQSQTMFARRVFEMLASNTVTVGNYSRGLKNYFGDLTICTDDRQTLEKDLERYCGDKETAGKYRLAGLRKVLSEHLYEDRLDYIVRKVFGVSLKRALPKIGMLARCRNSEEVLKAKEIYERQSYKEKVLYIIDERGDCEEREEDTVRLRYLSKKEAVEKMCGEEEGIEYYACISVRDYYGENYLLDLALTLRYGSYDVIGKGTYYTKRNGRVEKEERNKEYAEAAELVSRRAIVKAEALRGESIWDGSEEGRIYTEGRIYSADVYNYCENHTGDRCEEADDLQIKDTGIELKRIEEAAERIEGIEQNEEEVTVISGKELKENMGEGKKVRCEGVGNDLKIEGKNEEGEYEYIYSRKKYGIKGKTKEGKLEIKFKAEGTLDCICVCVFYDGDGNKLKPEYPRKNVGAELEVPPGAEYVVIGFRPKGQGIFIVKSVTIGGSRYNGDRKGCFLSRSDCLILSNHYPAYENLYRNMFVHKRVEQYKQKGYVADVMRMHKDAEDIYREFAGINIVEGQMGTLASILESGQIKRVCVHFLDCDIWNVLKNYVDSIKIYVWSHGADIQPWYRREFNYKTDAEKEKAKKESEVRTSFWSSIFANLDKYPNIHFIFVSKYFANMVFEDYSVKLPEDRYTIIHNCIDTNLFEYVPKSSEQRKKLLSIRPYASETYANDLTVKCIQELANKAYFNELEFRIIGNGELFDSILKPLKKYDNVIIEKRFLRQDEIAAMHKEYGIFLVPTREDTQGVSRDEAMASGLVPVTNAVAAIPEFADNSCAVLAPGEDYGAMAEGIDALYNNPDIFLQMSANAAQRVRSQSSQEYTIDKEIDLIYT